ncbi:MAG: phosphate ABC transporter ATP-binding protein [Armatimonadetes bacterium]|nr:phosphate ABC transporter ATP-binding protein [Armatimonadota bacterium]
MKAQIEVRNLSLAYRGNLALKDIGVDIPEKQVTAIIGPSGCGKSSLLRCLNRMIDLIPGTKVRGKVTLDGEDIYGSRVDVMDLRKRVGMICQKPVPLPMSIYENVAFGPRLYGVHGKALKHAVERSLRSAGLWEEVKDRLKEPAIRLSIGQQQRLCLARGLAVEPEVLLFDEPTSSLDPVSARHVEQQVAELKRDYTVVIVTHDLHQAKRVADHVMFLYLGELIENGTTTQVFESPQDYWTRMYVAGAGI